MAFHRMSRDVLSRPGLLVPQLFWVVWIRRVYDVDRYRIWIPTYSNDTHRIALSNDIKSKRENILDTI